MRRLALWTGILALCCATALAWATTVGDLQAAGRVAQRVHRRARQVHLDLPRIRLAQPVAALGDLGTAGLRRGTQVGIYF